MQDNVGRGPEWSESVTQGDTETGETGENTGDMEPGQMDTEIRGPWSLIRSESDVFTPGDTERESGLTVLMRYSH